MMDAVDALVLLIGVIGRPCVACPMRDQPDRVVVPESAYSGYSASCY